MADSIRNIATKEVEDEWNRLNFSGEIKALDRIILKAVFENPGATMRELAEVVGCDHSVVCRRLSRPSVIKARQLFEGTFSDQMHGAAGKYVRLINRTLDKVDEDPEEALNRIYIKFGNDPEALSKALDLIGRTYDPKLAHEMGKVTIGFLAKESELQLRAKEGGQGKAAAPMSIDEAKQILDADFVMQPDEPFTVEDL